VKTRVLFPLYAVIFISSLGFAAIITVFTPMLMHPLWDIIDPTAPLSFRLILLGLLLGLYPLGQFFGAPFLIAFSDRYGRKLVFLGSLFVTALAYLAIALCVHFQLIFLLFGSIFLAGLSESNLALAECAISDLAIPHHHRRLLTYIHVVWSTAFLCGPIVAAIFTNSNLGPWFNLATPFAVIALLLFISGGWIFAFFKETKEKRSATYIPAQRAFTHFLSAFAQKGMRSFYGINFFFYLAIFGFLRAYPIHLVTLFDLSIAGLAKFSVWVAIPLIITDFWLTDWAQKKVSSKTLLIYSGSITSLSMFLMALSPIHGTFLWAILFVAAFGIGFSLPVCPFFISHKARRVLYGEILTHDETLRTGTEAFATLIVGFLAAAAVALPLIAFAIAALIGTILLIVKK